jgi:hypothetical protein
MKLDLNVAVVYFMPRALFLCANSRFWQKFIQFEVHFICWPVMTAMTCENPGNNLLVNEIWGFHDLNLAESLKEVSGRTHKHDFVIMISFYVLGERNPKNDLMSIN